MAKGKAVYPGPNEDIVCGIEKHHVDEIKRIIDDEQFVDSATQIVENVRCLLLNREQSLSLPDKIASIDSLNDRVFELHQSLTNLSEDEHAIIDRYLDTVNASSVNDMAEHIWNLHAAITEARKDSHFQAAKPTPVSIQKYSAQILAYYLLPLMQQHGISIRCTASEAAISDAIRLLQILGEATGIYLKPDTWNRRLVDAKHLLQEQYETD